MKEKVIAIFDIGKTNKKLILFNLDLKPVFETEERFPEITDDDGFPCDDIEKIEQWILKCLYDTVENRSFDLTAVNFATYGATIVYIDNNGKRTGPVYNYLKPIDERIPERIYKRHGGQDEFCRRTASPALGMLNSGIQALWLKNSKPERFSSVKHILHFPQYLSYFLTGRVYSEHTSIGCHTALWDFDNMQYHPWLAAEGITLPEPSDIGTINEIELAGKKIKAGIGIHDSSSSLAPYFIGSKGSFHLMSTGTWCISMNPFNTDLLTAEQLDRDCLCYMSITRQPVKSSRLFLGHLHETAARRLEDHFKMPPDSYKKVKPDKKLSEALSRKWKGKRFYFEQAPYSRELRENLDFYTFKSFEEGYHQLISELVQLTTEANDLVLPAHNNIENIYITGGFSNNPIFLQLISESYPAKKVFTSEIANSTALGAALVMIRSMGIMTTPELNLGLTRI